MGRLIRAHDWARTPLGDASAWPIALRIVVQIVIDTGHPAFIFWGPDHVCLYNDAYSLSLGADKHPSILGAPGVQAFPEIWSVIGPQIEQVMAGGEATWHENQLVPIIRDGLPAQTYWTYSYGPIADATAPSGVGGVLVLVTETTSQVRTRQKLEADDERWRALLEQTPGFVCILRESRHLIEFANSGTRKLVNDRPLVGLTVEEALPDLASQGFIALLDRVYASGDAFTAHAMPVMLHNADGIEQQFYLDFIYQPITEDGRVTGIFVQGSDMTDGVRAGMALAQSEARWRALADNLPGGAVFIVDRNMRYLVAAGEALRDAGLASEQVVGRKVHDVVAPDRVQEYVAAYEQALAGQPFDLDHFDHGRHYVTRGVPLRDEDGEVYAALAASYDVSELKQLQQSLIDSDRHKDRFLAVLAHELRNPLAPLLNAATLIAHDNLDTTRLAWCKGVLERQVSRMGVLIDDLMDLSGIRYGRLKITKAPVALRSIIDNAVESVSVTVAQRKQELQVEFPWPDVHLLADSGRLTQVLTNLLTNATKYTPLGGKVQLVVRRVGDDVEIVVRDNGIGLEPHHCNRIFEMFTQIDRTLGGPAGDLQDGMGIGLALVKGFVELHGGRVRAHSAGIGHGSVFTVTLPATLVQVVTPVPLPPVAVANVAVRRVLIADDNIDAAETLALLLELAGHTTRVVEDGLSAITACGEFDPQVVLLDISMPGLNGYEVAERVRANPAHAAVLLVALTGLGFDENREAARRAGFDHHFTKPVDPETVLRVVANA